MRVLLKVALWLILTGCGSPSDVELTLAVASNMQFAMEELVGAFEKTHQIKCATVVGSSGKLTAQIAEGAPYDILVSADLKYPEALNRSGLAKTEPAIYAYGKLVIWSISGGLVPSIEQLQSPDVKHVALPNPKIAPYGMAAMEILRHHGIQEAIQDKLVFGESISQTNQFIVSGSAEIGFTAKSVVLSSPMKNTGRWKEMDQELYTPLAQGVIILDNENSQNSRQFFDFLFSPDGQEILRKFGYVTP